MDGVGELSLLVLTMDNVFDPTGMPFDSVHRVILVISILRGGRGVALVGVVAPTVLEESSHCVMVWTLQKLIWA